MSDEDSKANVQLSPLIALKALRKLQFECVKESVQLLFSSLFLKVLYLESIFQKSYLQL